MNKITPQLIIFFITGLSLAFGQSEEESLPKLLSEESRNRIGFGLGFHRTQIQDLVYSPLIYDGQSLAAIELSYQHRSKKGLHILRTVFDRTFVKSTDPITLPFFNTPITRQSSTATFLNLKYGYAREIIHKKNFNLLLGGMLDNQIHAVEYRFAESDDIGYLLSYAVAAWLRGEYRIDRTQFLHFETSFPLISFLSRPPYAVVDNGSIQSNSDFSNIHRRGKLQALSGFVKLHLLLNYTRALSSQFDLLLSYQFNYYSVTEPQKLSVVKNNFDLGLAFKF